MKDNIIWTVADGFQGIAEQDRADWSVAYPACDIDRQLASANQWLLSNPSKAHKKQWRRFITGWLGRSQERGGDSRVSGGDFQRLAPKEQAKGHITKYQLGDRWPEIWTLLCELWPGWGANNTEVKEWNAIFCRHTFEDCERAIRDHWRESTWKAPTPDGIKKCLSAGYQARPRVNTGGRPSPWSIRETDRQTMRDRATRRSWIENLPEADVVTLLGKLARHTLNGLCWKDLSKHDYGSPATWPINLVMACWCMSRGEMNWAGAYDVAKDGDLVRAPAWLLPTG